jgi:hypothetical protein
MKRIWFVLFGLVVLTAPTAQAQSSLASGLVAYYPFKGNANDASGNGNNGTVVGATLTPDRFGSPDSAYSFDGISNLISIPDFSQADANVHTLSVWILANSWTNINSSAIYVDIFDKDDATAGQRQWVYQGTQTGQIRAAVFTSMGEYDLDTISQLQTNQWYQVVTVWDGTNESAFVNGVFDSSIPAPGTLVQASAPVRIGGNPVDDQEFFDGKINDVRIYNRALSASEVQQLYAVEVTPPSVSGCALFSRPTDTISINGHTLVTNQITIEAEILIPSSLPVPPAQTYPRLFEEQLSTQGDKAFWASPSIVGGGTWVVDNQNRLIAVANPASNDVWHHLAFVQDTNEYRVYLDGIEIGIEDFAGDPLIANSPDSVMSIGAFLYTDGGALAQSFIGAIQWLRVSSVARYSGSWMTPPVTVPDSDAATQVLFDFTHVTPGTTIVYDLSPNHFIGTVAVGFSGATAPSFVLPAPPVLQTVAQTNQTLTLTWSTVAGQIYQLQYTTNLAQQTWNSLGYPMVATNGVITASDTIGPDAQRFYRVVQSP